MFASWLKRLLNLTPPAERPRRRPPGVELLEGRLAPTVQAVSLADPTLISDTANANSSNARVAAGSGGRYVVFQSDANNLVPGIPFGHTHIYRRDTATGTTILIDTGVLGVANDSSTNPSLSADGSRVAFASNAYNLVVGAGGSGNEIFVKDLNTGAVLLASATTGGFQASSPAASPVIGGDGTRVAFLSKATNLVGGAGGSSTQAFVKDLGTHAVYLASADASGTQANTDVGAPSLSDDGTRAAFQTQATNLVSGAGGSSSQVFVKDLGTSAVFLASADAGGAPANRSAGTPSLSGDGTAVAFASSATNLVGGAGGSFSQVFAKDLVSNLVSLVSADAGGTQGNADSGSPAFSADGSHVALVSHATNLVSGVGPLSQAYVKDLGTRAIVLASAGGAGAPANRAVLNPSPSGDGRFVAFETLADNLVALNDYNQSTDTFLADLAAGTVGLVSRRDPVLAALTADANSLTTPELRQVSADGRYVVFRSSADNLVPGVADGNRAHLFRRDTTTGTTVLVDAGAGGVLADQTSVNPSISADGRYVAFQSKASNLVPAADGTSDQVFVKDLGTGAVSLASAGAGGVEANNAATGPALGGDGTRVAFLSRATNLAAGADGSHTQVFVADLGTGAVYLASADAGGTEADKDAGAPSLSDDGSRVAFQTQATNLIPGVSGFPSHVFVKDLNANAVYLASASPDGTPGNFGGLLPALSGDGNRVAFQSSSTNLGAPTGGTKVFVKDLTTSAIFLGSGDTGGFPANADAQTPSLNEDGSRVAFVSHATNLVGGAGGVDEVFVKDLNTYAVVLASADSHGGQANTSAVAPSVSPDGYSVAFQSIATNLDPGDHNRVFNVFLAMLGGPLNYDASTHASITAYTLRKNGSRLEVVETANPGNVLASQALAGTTAVRITGHRGGSDALTIDFGFGGYFVAGGISFDGGAGATGAVLVTRGTSAETATYAPDALTPGQGQFVVNGSPLAFRNVAALDATALLAVHLTLPNANDLVSVADGVAAFDGVTPALTVSGSSGGVAFDPLNLYNDATVDLDLSAVAGNDTVTVNGDTVGGNANLTVTTRGDTDAVNVNGPVSLSGNLTLSAAQIELSPTAGLTTGGTQTYAGPVALLADTTIASTGLDAAGNITFAGTVGGTNGLTVTTAGTTTFGGNVALASLTTNGPGTTAFGVAATSVTTTNAQTYNDAVTVAASAITFATSGPAGDVTLAGALNGSGCNPTVTVCTSDPAAGISITGDVGTSTALSVLDIADAGAATLSGQVAGVTTAFAKDGTGTLWLTAAGPFTGAVNVDGGTLLLDGALGTSPNAVTVNDGGTLGGTGTLNRPLVANSGGTVSPGDPVNTPGILHTGVGGDATFNGGSTFLVELNPGPDGSPPTAGTDYNQLDVTGTVTLDGATLDGTGGPIPGGTQFQIITSGNPVFGGFAGGAEGGTVTVGGVAYTITYLGGSGNEVVLTAVG